MEKRFFLGGHDLEMLEIRNLLQEHGLTFFDKQLSWGAKLSDYKGEFSAEHQNICIELGEDMEPPPNYIRIDHHNELSDLPSSLEQVAEMLGIGLTREQQLIAANDKGYKPSMRAMGAAEEEIAAIRRKDRTAQGVTEEMEKAAEIAIKSAYRKSDIVVIDYIYDKFSPVTDRLDAKKLLVKSPRTAVYYGPGIKDLTKHFKDDIEGHKAYSGGGDPGFFGLAAGSYSTEELDKKIEDIMTRIGKPHSFHSFVFPFKWEHLFGDNTGKVFKDRVNLDLLEKKLGLGSAENNPNNKTPWKRESFVVHSALGYNEYNYFYDFVRDVIYDKKGVENKIKGIDSNSLVRHYEYGLPGVYSIKCNVGTEQHTYDLPIKKIFLDVYETGVAILSYHVLNYDNPKPEDILNINQFGRRVFPPSFKLGNYPSKNQLDITAEEQFTDMALSLSLHFDGLERKIEEDFAASKNIAEYETTPYLLPEIITGLFCKTQNNDSVITTDWNHQLETKKREDYIWIAPSIDDRMFVASWYCCSTSTKKHLLGAQALSESSFWYKYVFVDSQSGESVRNPDLQKELIRAATYARWGGYDTLYGISRYSFVMICNEEAFDYTKAVFETMYFKLAELSLVQRATVLRFSDEIQFVSSMEKDDDKATQIRRLYEYYIRFMNKINFREISPQEQAIELYDMLQQTMRIDGQTGYLDREMKRLNEYALLLQEGRRSRMMDLIAYVGLPITITSLVVTIISMLKGIKISRQNPTLTEINLFDRSWGWLMLGYVLMVSFSIGFVKSQFKNEWKGKWIENIYFWLFLIAFLFTIFSPFFKYFCFF